MDFLGMSNRNLVVYYESLKELHTGAISKKFCIREPDSCVEVFVRDERLNELLWTLQVEAFNEIHRRFPQEISL